MRTLARLAAIGLVVATLSCTRTVAVSGPYYTVDAPLMVTRSQPVRACNMILLSLPPAGCGGVEVTGANPAAVPGTSDYRNGTLVTPTVRIVGVWDGKVLALVQAPVIVGESCTEPTPVSAPPPATSIASDQEIDERIARDIPALRDSGIVVLSVGIGADGVEVVLAVADPASVATMYQRYGRVHISGWLQPVS